MNPEEVEINGIKLRCKHCDGAEFLRSKVLLNTRGMTFVGLDWLNPSADVHICSTCGFLHWFFGVTEETVEPIEDVSRWSSDKSSESICLSCGEQIPPLETNCSKCGWTYSGGSPST